MMGDSLHLRCGELSGCHMRAILCQEVRLDDSHCLQRQLSSTSMGHLSAECMINTCHEVCIYCPVVT